MVALVEDEDLGLMLEAAERGRMDDAVAIAAEGAAAFAGRLGVQPAAALRRIAGVGRAGYCSFHRSWPCRAAMAGQLTLAVAALNYRSKCRCNRRDSCKAILTANDGRHGDNVIVTERAAQKIGEILGREPAGTMLRVSVEGGGCSGFQYKFDTERSRADDDIVIEKQRRHGADRSGFARLHGRLGDRFRRRPDRFVLQDQ